MRHELFREVDSVLSNSGSAGVRLEQSAISSVWTAFQRKRPGMNWSRPWALYTLMRWARHNDVGFDSASREPRLFLAV
jgi:hypothetical protein